MRSTHIRRPLLGAVAVVAGLAVVAGPTVAGGEENPPQPTTTTAGQAASTQPAQYQQTPPQEQAPAPQPAPERREPSQAEIDAYWRAVHEAKMAERRERFRDAVARRDWLRALEQFDWNAALAHRIVRCESNFRPEARNGRHRGLFQIAHGTYDAAGNIEHAYAMYQKRGWQPWYASRRCWRTR